MNPRLSVFSFRRRAERFAQLLDEANGGRRHHVRSPVDDDLAELVVVGDRIRGMRPTVEVDPDFRTSLRAMLVATAEREGIGATASPDPLGEEKPGRAAAGGSTQGGFHPTLRPRGGRARGAILVGVAAGAIAVSSMSAASENAVPGDALYGMKRSTERAQLALASSDLSRGQLFLDFAQTRLAEADAVRGDRAGFTRVLDDMDADTRQGIKLLTTSAVQREDEAALDAIGSFLTSQRREVSALLDGASRAERDRTGKSLGLLDSISRRAEGLRAALRCDAAPATRADALGPLPQSCASPRSIPTTGQPPAQSEHRTGNRVPEAPRPEKADQTLAPEIVPTTPASHLPKMTKPIDGKPADGRPAH